MIHIQINKELPMGEIDIHEEKLRLAAEETLLFADVSPSCEISIVITGNEQIRQLNAQYLGIDVPTDVLSFPADEVDPESGNPYLGDILIAFPYAQAQALTAGHAIGNELQLLVVHGVLHLLGYDHGQEADRIRMWAAQSELLRKLGCPDDIIPR
jgi:probable rRNA maturation factor